MNVRQVVFPVPAGGDVMLAFPEPVTLESIEVLQRASVLLVESLRHSAQRQGTEDAGAIEYDSWLHCADAGAIEYDSWQSRP
jgi:hypothetical protein